MTSASLLHGHEHPLLPLSHTTPHPRSHATPHKGEGMLREGAWRTLKDVRERGSAGCSYEGVCCLTQRVSCMHAAISPRASIAALRAREVGSALCVSVIGVCASASSSG